MSKGEYAIRFNAVYAVIFVVSNAVIFATGLVLEKAPATGTGHGKCLYARRKDNAAVRTGYVFLRWSRSPGRPLLHPERSFIFFNIAGGAAARTAKEHFLDIKGQTVRAGGTFAGIIDVHLFSVAPVFLFAETGGNLWVCGSLAGAF